MASTGEEAELPSELQERLTSFDESLTQIEAIIQSLISVPLNQIHAQLSTLDCAKLDLIAAYAVNSMFWSKHGLSLALCRKPILDSNSVKTVYLNTQGENPKIHGVKQELDRIRSYMGRVKEIQDKEKAPKLDTGASKRFIRSALWSAAHAQAKKRQSQGGDEDTDSASTNTTEPSGTAGPPAARSGGPAPKLPRDNFNRHGKKRKKSKR